ncbi:MAG: O-antigen ligase family protein [Saprospiraceae bacterium]
MPSETRKIDKLSGFFITNWDKILVWALGLICVGVSLLAIRYNNYNFFAIPAILAGVVVAIFDFRIIYLLLIAAIPFSVEIYLPGGLATDLPTEPLMWVLLGVSFIYVLLNLNQIDLKPLKHPITIFLLLHLGWIVATMISSELFIFSLKYTLAKIWYIVVFYFLTIKFLSGNIDFIRKMIYPCLISLVIVVSICLFRHAAIDFSYTLVNRVVGPFFQNHVAYACLPATFLPFAWYSLHWHRKWSLTWILLVLGMVILMLAVQFSYTRTVYVALLMGIGVYFVIKYKMMKWVLGSFLILVTVATLFLVRNNRFLDFAPDFSKTVSHQSFDNLLNATYKLQDISTMERVYRWIAAGNMIADKPWMGFGPGNFYQFYKSYTVSSFRTYVSDNQERSSTHCYFLLVCVEQGVLGLLIFLLFNLGVLLLGEKVYHQAKDINIKRISLMASISFVIINGILLINDMVETDKIGSFYFICAAILVSLDLKNKELRIRN